jgi:hypothetical protein
MMMAWKKEAAVEVWTVRRSEKVMNRSTLLEEQEMTGETINDVHDNMGTGTIFSVHTTRQRESWGFVAREKCFAMKPRHYSIVTRANAGKPHPNEQSSSRSRLVEATR